MNNIINPATFRQFQTNSAYYKPVVHTPSQIQQKTEKKNSHIKGVFREVMADSLIPVISLGILAAVGLALKGRFDKFQKFYEMKKAIKTPEKAIVSDKEAKVVLSELNENLQKQFIKVRNSILKAGNSSDKTNNITILVGEGGTGKTYLAKRLFRFSEEVEKKHGILRIPLDRDNTSTVMDMLLDINNPQSRPGIIKMLDKKLGAQVRTIVLEADEIENPAYYRLLTADIKQIFGQDVQVDDKKRSIATELIFTCNKVPDYYVNDPAVTSRTTIISIPKPSPDEIIKAVIPRFKKLFNGVSSDELKQTEEILRNNLPNFAYNYRSFTKTHVEEALKQNYNRYQNLPKAVLETMNDELMIRGDTFKKTLREYISDKFIDNYRKVKSNNACKNVLLNLTDYSREISSKRGQGLSIRFLDELESATGEVISLDQFSRLLSGKLNPGQEASSDFIRKLDDRLVEYLQNNENINFNKQPKELVEDIITNVINTMNMGNNVNIPEKDDIQEFYKLIVRDIHDSSVNKVTLNGFKNALSYTFDHLSQDMEDLGNTDLDFLKSRFNRYFNSAIRYDFID